MIVLFVNDLTLFFAQYTREGKGKTCESEIYDQQKQKERTDE